jgi:hypothetical protein
MPGKLIEDVNGEGRCSVLYHASKVIGVSCGLTGVLKHREIQVHLGHLPIRKGNASMAGPGLHADFTQARDTPAKSLPIAIQKSFKLLRRTIFPTDMTNFSTNGGRSLCFERANVIREGCRDSIIFRVVAHLSRMAPLDCSDEGRGADRPRASTPTWKTTTSCGQNALDTGATCYSSVPHWRSLPSLFLQQCVVPHQYLQSTSR